MDDRGLEAGLKVL
jgi:hypothetical protein